MISKDISPAPVQKVTVEQYFSSWQSILKNSHWISMKFAVGIFGLPELSCSATTGPYFIFLRIRK